MSRENHTASNSDARKRLEEKRAAEAAEPRIQCMHCGADVEAQGYLCCPQPKSGA